MASDLLGIVLDLENFCWSWNQNAFETEGIYKWLKVSRFY